MLLGSMQQTKHAQYSNECQLDFGSLTSWMLTLSVPAPCCCCPLVDLRLELHASSETASELACLFFPQQEVWLGTIHLSWFQPSAALMQLLSLAFSLPDIQMQAELTDLNCRSNLEVAESLLNTLMLI